MNAPSRIPTHLDYCHDMARAAAQMAGYDFDDLSTAWDDPAKRELAGSFMRKGMAAVKLLGPAAVDLDPVEGDKIPDDIRAAGRADGKHAVAIAREWRGLSVDDLAKLAGLSPVLVRAIETRAAPANEMHEFALAAVLKVSPHALTDWGVTGPELDRHEWMSDTLADLATCGGKAA